MRTLAFASALLAATPAAADYMVKEVGSFHIGGGQVTLVESVRQLFGNTSPYLQQASDAWSLRHPVVYTLIWVVVLLAVFVPLSVRIYQRTASR